MSTMAPRPLVRNFKKFPAAPGIYLFYNSKKELIYVGKATSLKNRVKSYFQGRRTPRPIEEMIHEVTDIKYKETNSALEAIILEAIYIKKFLPRYNVLGKDDKSWNYFALTAESFPKLVSVRQHELDVDVRTAKTAKVRKKYLYVFGPYPGLNTKAAMKILRRLFRFSTCLPRRNGVKAGASYLKRPCLYYEMGQCLGVCTGEITARQYRARVIRPLVLFLGGKTGVVIKFFKTQMRVASLAERYETAARLRDQLAQLTRLQDVALLNKSWFVDARTANNYEITKDRLLVNRIEGYDISNLGATEKVGSRVVFDSAGPIKNQYRKFIIKTVSGQSDVGSLAEVLERRLRHSEWPLPDLFLIDGGRPQVQAVARVLQRAGVVRPVLGIAKGPKRARNDIILGPNTRAFIPWVDVHRSLLIQVRDEAHRFAISFHRARRARSHLPLP